MKTKIRNAGPTNSSSNLPFTKGPLLAYDNLRTLCSKCHNNVTVNFTMARHYESKVRSSAETARALIKYYAIGNAKKAGPKLK